jgi:hypothetical protein
VLTVVKAPANTYQAGIFALGTASHAYLEFDDEGGVEGAATVAAIAGLRQPRTTMGGVNLVAGFRPELWRSVAQGGLPDDVAGFTSPLVGAGGFTMPATQHDAVLWISGSAYDVVAMLESMAGVHDGVRDALTYFTTPLTGAYYFISSLAALRSRRTPRASPTATARGTGTGKAMETGRRTAKT